jgi:hypothetical protein
MNSWLSEYRNKQKTVPLYTCEINIETLKITRDACLVESDYDCQLPSPEGDGLLEDLNP